MSFVAVVDYGLCNLDSISRALEVCGAQVRITGEPAELGTADRILLPGVGAFGDGMRQLRESGLAGALVEQAGLGIPILGICLGMQLLATRGTEGGDAQGLGLIPGTVERLRPIARAQRIPHVGWNEVNPRSDDHALFSGIPAGRDFYFVHSYHYCCDSPEHVLATTPYCGEFASVVGAGNVVGVQFHPEKSQRIGFALLRNFLGM